MIFFTEEYIREQCTKEPWCQHKAGHVLFGKVHKDFLEVSEKMPDGMPAKQEFIDAAAIAKRIYGEQVWAELNTPPLDDDRIREWCKKEPWTTAVRIEDISTSTFGYIIEKLHFARDCFAKDTPEHTAFEGTLVKVRQIYFDDMRRMANQYASGKTRVEVEAKCNELNTMAHRYEDNGTFVGNRLFSMAVYCGYFQQLNGGQPVVRPDSMQQMVLKDKNTPTPP